MWTILLVEDEPYFRLSIRNKFQWGQYGFQIVGEASHGEEALELVEKLNPDLIVSDIMMPYMDGIELLKAVRKQGRTTSFVLLTCMSDFEYARQALTYGASGYLLKLSMNEEDLQSVLHKVNKELTARASELMKQNLQAAVKCYETLWNRMAGKKVSAEAIDEVAVFLANVPALDVVVYTHLHGDSSFNLKQGEEMLFKDVGVDPLNPRVLHEYTCFGQTTVFAWNMGMPASSPEHSPKQTEQSGATPLVRLVKPDKLAEAWLLNMRALDSNWYGQLQSSRKLVVDAEWNYVSKEQQGTVTKTDVNPIPWKEERNLLSAFEQRQINSCASQLSAIWLSMEQAFIPMVLVKEAAERLDKMFSRISGNTWDGIQSIHCAGAHYQLLSIVKERMERYAKGSSNRDMLVTDHPEINKTIGYITQNYDKEISLGELARYISMDDNYLSNLFKRKTGKTVIQYIQEVRVEQAKFYLEQTDLTISEIVERVGFGNDNYFFKIFKRFTDMTPNEYRVDYKPKASFSTGQKQ
jgi:two-component system response regulator YesN